MKSPAPLLSLNPSGTFAGLITASIWKGRNYIRQRVDPSNPKTADQMTARVYLGAMAKACRAVLTSYKDESGVGSPFFTLTRDSAPSGQSWISFIQKYAKDVLDKANAHWEDLDATEQGYFTTNAATLGLSDYYLAGAGLLSDEFTKGIQLMALGFFGKDYLEDATCAAAVNDNSPSSGEVDALAALIGTTTP